MCLFGQEKCIFHETAGSKIAGKMKDIRWNLKKLLSWPYCHLISTEHQIICNCPKARHDNT